MSEVEFASAEDWLKRATLPAGIAAHPSFAKEAVIEIAKEFAFDEPDFLQTFWQHVTHIANDYEGLAGVSFANERAALKDLAKKLNRRIARTLELLDDPAEQERLRHLNNHVSLCAMRELESRVDDEEGFFASSASREASFIAAPITRLRSQLEFTAAALDTLEIPLRAGQPSKNYALDVFVRQLIAFWENGLNRNFHFDQNEIVPKSGGGRFIERCSNTLADLEAKPVMDAIRRVSPGR